MSTPFNVPDLSDRERGYLLESLASRKISGDGPFTQRCHEYLRKVYSAPTLLMHSCTAAMEAAAILADLRPGDEVIMPSFTFVSTANAVVLRGAVPVFIDVRPDTLNIDETLIAPAITDRTRAIMPVHYAGVSAEMDAINAIAKDHNLIVIEDAAQAYGARYNGRPVGTSGRFAALSFHETKNVVSGEGGALIINDPRDADRATFIREKGTNRTQFLRKEVMKYEWIDVGSSFLPSDLLAALLLAQLERGDDINKRRLSIWNRYKTGLMPLQEQGLASLPSPPQKCEHNAHIFFLKMKTPELQASVLMRLKADGIGASTHYVPLHSSPAGQRFARHHGSMAVTDHITSVMFRLPMFAGLEDDLVSEIVARTIHHTYAAAEELRLGN